MKGHPFWPAKILEVARKEATPPLASLVTDETATPKDGCEKRGRKPKSPRFEYLVEFYGEKASR
jgi:hypothetical protein